MCDVPKTCDEFGSYLSRLRAARQLTGKELGNAVGKSDDYIGGWERYPRPVNKEILHKVCQVLELGQAERHQLFHLADERLGLETVREGYGWWGQMMLNVSQALSEVEHEIDPAVSSQGLMDLNEAASWVLAYYGTAGFPNDGMFTRLAWPEAFHREKIITGHQKFKVKPHPIPPELIEEELPQAGQIDELTRETVQAIGMGMANLYRRWLLTDLEWCRFVARGLKRWSVTGGLESGPVVRFTFKDIDAQKHNVPGVSCDVVNSVVRRDLAGFMWMFDNGRPKEDEFRLFPFPRESVDSQAYMAFQLAKAYLSFKPSAEAESFWDAADITKAYFRQGLEDSLFILRAWAWDSPSAVGTIFGLLGEDLFPKDAMVKLKAAGHVGQLRLHPMVEEAKDLMIDTLEKTIRRLDREAQRAPAGEEKSVPKKIRKARAAKKKRAKARKKVQGKRGRR